MPKRRAAPPAREYKGPPCQRPVRPTKHKLLSASANRKYGRCTQCGALVGPPSRGLLGEARRISATPAFLFGDLTPQVVSGRRGRRVERTPWRA